MQTLNIMATSTESARAIIETLSRFRAELIDAGDGGCEVTVTLGGSDGEIVAVLDALEQYVTARGCAARLSLDGRKYVMHPDSVA